MSARLVPDDIAGSSEQLIHYDGPGMCGQVKRATMRSLLKLQPTKSLPTGLKRIRPNRRRSQALNLTAVSAAPPPVKTAPLTERVRNFFRKLWPFGS